MRHRQDFDPAKKINWKIFQVIWPYLLEYKVRIGIAIVCLVLSKAASVYGPFLLKDIVDTLNPTASGGNAPSIPNLMAVPIGLVLAYGFARFSMIILGEIRDTVFGRVTERAMRRIGLQVFNHVHSLDLDFHLNRRTGGLSSHRRTGCVLLRLAAAAAVRSLPSSRFFRREVPTKAEQCTSAHISTSMLRLRHGGIVGAQQKKRLSAARVDFGHDAPPASRVPLDHNGP